VGGGDEVGTLVEVATIGICVGVVVACVAVGGTGVAGVTGTLVGSGNLVGSAIVVGVGMGAGVAAPLLLEIATTISTTSTIATMPAPAKSNPQGTLNGYGNGLRSARTRSA
jgi:hypothetical protein